MELGEPPRRVETTLLQLVSLLNASEVSHVRRGLVLLRRSMDVELTGGNTTDSLLPTMLELQQDTLLFQYLASSPSCREIEQVAQTLAGMNLRGMKQQVRTEAVYLASELMTTTSRMCLHTMNTSFQKQTTTLLQTLIREYADLFKNVVHSDDPRHKTAALLLTLACARSTHLMNTLLESALLAARVTRLNTNNNDSTLKQAQLRMHFLLVEVAASALTQRNDTLRQLLQQANFLFSGAARVTRKLLASGATLKADVFGANVSVRAWRRDTAAEGQATPDEAMSDGEEGEDEETVDTDDVTTCAITGGSAVTRIVGGIESLLKRQGVAAGLRHCSSRLMSLFSVLALPAVLAEAPLRERVLSLCETLCECAPSEQKDDFAFDTAKTTESRVLRCRTTDMVWKNLAKITAQFAVLSTAASALMLDQLGDNVSVIGDGVITEGDGYTGDLPRAMLRSDCALSLVIALRMCQLAPAQIPHVCQLYLQEYAVTEARESWMFVTHASMLSAMYRTLADAVGGTLEFADAETPPQASDRVLKPSLPARMGAVCTDGVSAESATVQVTVCRLMQATCQLCQSLGVSSVISDGVMATPSLRSLIDRMTALVSTESTQAEHVLHLVRLTLTLVPLKSRQVAAVGAESLLEVATSPLVGSSAALTLATTQLLSHLCAASAVKTLRHPDLLSRCLAPLRAQMTKLREQVMLAKHTNQDASLLEQNETRLKQLEKASGDFCRAVLGATHLFVDQVELSEVTKLCARGQEQQHVVSTCAALATRQLRHCMPDGAQQAYSPVVLNLLRWIRHVTPGVQTDQDSVWHIEGLCGHEEVLPDVLETVATLLCRALRPQQLAQRVAVALEFAQFEKSSLWTCHDVRSLATALKQPFVTVSDEELLKHVENKKSAKKLRSLLSLVCHSLRADGVADSVTSDQVIDDGVIASVTRAIARSSGADESSKATWQLHWLTRVVSLQARAITVVLSVSHEVAAQVLDRTVETTTEPSQYLAQYLPQHASPSLSDTLLRLFAHVRDASLLARVASQLSRQLLQERRTGKSLALTTLKRKYCVVFDAFLRCDKAHRYVKGLRATVRFLAVSLLDAATAHAKWAKKPSRQRKLEARLQYLTRVIATLVTVDIAGIIDSDTNGDTDTDTDGDTDTSECDGVEVLRRVLACRHVHSDTVFEFCALLIDLSGHVVDRSLTVSLCDLYTDSNRACTDTDKNSDTDKHPDTDTNTDTDTDLVGTVNSSVAVLLPRVYCVSGGDTELSDRVLDIALCHFGATLSRNDTLVWRRLLAPSAGMQLSTVIPRVTTDGNSATSDHATSDHATSDSATTDGDSATTDGDTSGDGVFLFDAEFESDDVERVLRQYASLARPFGHARRRRLAGDDFLWRVFERRRLQQAQPSHNAAGDRRYNLPLVLRLAFVALCRSLDVTRFAESRLLSATVLALADHCEVTRHLALRVLSLLRIVLAWRQAIDEHDTDAEFEFSGGSAHRPRPVQCRPVVQQAVDMLRNSVQQGRTRLPSLCLSAWCHAVILVLKGGRMYLPAQVPVRAAVADKQEGDPSTTLFTAAGRFCCRDVVLHSREVPLFDRLFLNSAAQVRTVAQHRLCRRAALQIVRDAVSSHSAKDFVVLRQCRALEALINALYTREDASETQLVCVIMSHLCQGRFARNELLDKHAFLPMLRALLSSLCAETPSTGTEQALRAALGLAQSLLHALLRDTTRRNSPLVLPQLQALRQTVLSLRQTPHGSSSDTTKRVVAIESLFVALQYSY
ncbi:MAG: hypothetical protein MHM6MM_000152 [Cercozoa sp. M6MM]